MRDKHKNIDQMLYEHIDMQVIPENEKQDLKMQAAIMFEEMQSKKVCKAREVAQKFHNEIVTILRDENNLSLLKNLSIAANDMAIEAETLIPKNEIQEIEEIEQMLLSSRENKSAEGMIGYRLAAPLEHLGNSLGGIQQGLMLFGGSSHIGKTAILLNMVKAIYNGNGLDVKIIYFALDDRTTYFAKRIIAVFSDCDIDKVLSVGGCNEDEKRIIEEGYQFLLQMLRSGTLTIRDQRRIKTTADIEKVLREYKTEKAIFVIDGFMNMSVAGIKTSDPRVEAIKRYDAIKTLSDIYDVPIIASVELGKNVQETDATNPPTKANLMETGKGIYHASQILMIYPFETEDLKNDDISKVDIVIKIEKNKRFRGKGIIPMSMSKKSGVFEEMKYIEREIAFDRLRGLTKKGVRRNAY